MLFAACVYCFGCKRKQNILFWVSVATCFSVFSTHFDYVLSPLPNNSTLTLCISSVVCKHLDDFNSHWPRCICFRCLLCDLYSVAFFPGCSTNLLTLEGFVWKKQVKIYLHIIAVWPVGVLDVAMLSRQLSAGLLMKTHKHRKFDREHGNLRVLQGEICLIPWRSRPPHSPPPPPPCLNSA